MNIISFILMAIGMGATITVLVIGLVAMTRGGEFNDKWSNKLMRYRVIVQGFAIAMFMIGLSLMEKGN